MIDCHKSYFFTTEAILLVLKTVSLQAFVGILSLSI